ncbi:MAG: (Fe-S)-binding protein [Promethearchaeota archaeon]
MNEDDILRSISYCQNCFTCLDACDTFKVTNDILQSPNGRLKIAEKVFNNIEISEEEVRSLYTCTLCASCNIVCPQPIDIANIIHASKLELVDRKKAPLEIHEKIIKGIVDNNNSVGGNPEERLKWLPNNYLKTELFENADSDTLLFLGCMSSYRVKESATAPYEILKKAGYDFKILKNEPCCGEYAYSAGNLDLAKNIFKTNIELFIKCGIKNLIVTCGGCLYAFDTVYRKYFKEFNINVRHVVDIIYEMMIQKKIKFKDLDKTITYHDPCRLGRKYKNGPLFNEPREILQQCGVKIKELIETHEECPCCGAGSGIRGVDSTICIKIGKDLFDRVETNEIVSSCPLCVFNFRYVNYKIKKDKESKYITDYILDAIE